jgi:hypothetical protein
MGKFIVYEINTRVWLNTLSRRYSKPITLANVPAEVTRDLGKLGVSAIWLMGIWRRSALGIAGALRYKHEYVGALPDLTDEDVIGSAYAIGDYVVAPEAGGREGLAAFRAQLAEHGLKIILDYVPNHVAMDHPWVTGEDGLCVRGDAELYASRPGDFFQSARPDGSTVYTAHGRDPNFPPWNDTAQLNAWSPILRQATIDTLRDMADQCDGVRCDMAMLLMNDIFERTWGWRMQQQGMPRPEQEFWPQVIGAVRAHRPDFVFMAEAYWDLEYQLQQQGFDYTYDKRLYDRLRDEQPDELRVHLRADTGFQARCVRFIENHDEPRAVETFKPVAKHKMAAVVSLTTPGAVLLHDGQFSGRRIKLPVQIGREMDEPQDAHLMSFYADLLRELRAPEYDGQWHLLDTHGGLLAYVWMTPQSARLMIANLTHHVHEGSIQLPDALANRMLVNVMTGQAMLHAGGTLHVKFHPYHTSIYHIDLTAAPQRATLWETCKRVVKAGINRIFGGGFRG